MLGLRGRFQILLTVFVPALLALQLPGVAQVAAASDAITAKLQATRLSGPAPLATLFDATETTAKDVALPYHQLVYDFDFGDERGEKWAVSGKPKNTQSGAPLAAHVFDNPGTYTVRLKVTNPATKESAEATVQVEVKDPAKVFAGENTICVSNVGAFDDCPAGALRAKEIPRVLANKRLLLRRGERFTGVALRGNNDNVLIASYGTGSKPVLDTVQLSGAKGPVGAWPDDVTVMDLNLLNGFRVESGGSRILLYRCDMIEPNREKIDVGTVLPYLIGQRERAADRYTWPREIFIVENVAIGDTGDDNVPHMVFMGYLMKSALLGNVFNKATEHTVRVWAGYKAVIAHNEIGGEHHAGNPPGIRAALKFQSGGIGDYNDNIGISTMQVASRYLVTADNRFGSVDYPGSWMVTFGPQNEVADTVEGLEDLIMERDTFLRGPYSSQDIHNVVRRSTVRDETAVNGQPILMHQVGPHEWRGNPILKDWAGPYFGMPNN